MIFTGPHWWAGLVQIGVLAAELLLLLLILRRYPKISNVVILCAGLYFLAYKLWENIYNHKWPIDFSAVTYFLFGIAALLPFRPLKTTASFSGFLAGSIFIASFILFPEVHVKTSPSLYYRAMGVFNHNLLFTVSFAMMFQYRFSKSHIACIIGWLAVAAIYAEVMINVLHVSDTIEIITQIIDGSILSELIPGFTPAWWSLLIYYLLFAALLGAFLWLTYRLNSLFIKEPGEAKGGEPTPDINPTL